VTIMLQTEAPNASSFRCVDSDTKAAVAVLCSRTWEGTESGGVGSCFFLLPAGHSFTCTSPAGQAGVNAIDSSYALLSGSVTASAGWAPVACPGAGGGSCSLPNTGATDLWIQAAFASSPAAGANADNNASSSLACTLVGGTASGSPPSSPSVCSFSTSTTSTSPTASSCAILVPAGATLVCTAAGAPLAYEQSQALTFSAPYALAPPASSPPAQAPCPPASFPSTDMCDCSSPVANATAGAGAAAASTAAAVGDQVISISSVAVDGNFSSYHCFIDGANVCAFGVDSSNAGLGGGCTFILPAGASYTCTMEWGALSFRATALLHTTRSLFGSGRGAPLGTRRAAPLSLPHPAPRDPAERSRLRALHASWRAEHGLLLATHSQSESESLANFVQHVYHAEEVLRRGQVVGRPGLDAQGRPTTFNRFAGMSRQEFESAYKPSPPLTQQQRRSPATSLPSPALSSSAPAPSSMNWTALGMVTAVEDQGQCGSCWSFSTTGVVESAWAIAGNPLVPLSQQALVSCETDCQGCGGGWPYLAIDWLATQGAYTDASYPYVSGGGSAPACSPPPPSGRASANVTGYYRVGNPDTNTTAELEAELVNYVGIYGPVSVSLDAMTQIWWTYVGGVVVGCCNDDVDHAVLVTGYGVDGPTGLAYHIIKNSWSETWGEQGYIRLARGSNQCDIVYDPVIPTVNGGVLPPPPPPPKPLPPWQCPADAVSVNTSTSAACLWHNNTNGMVMPPNPSEYCDYVADGYMGYVWTTADGPQSAFPCAPSFSAGSNGGTDFFCTLTNGTNFVTFPAGIRALCANLSSGVIGWEWDVTMA
jgi:hypothetical protein